MAAAEENLIKSENLARVREIDFVYRFNDSIKKLIEALGITRKIPKVSGTVLKAYKAEGKLDETEVEEGATIPLSKYETKAIHFDEIKIEKYRKATSIEAISEKGFDQAVQMTTDAMLKDVQKKIKAKFFNFLKENKSSTNVNESTFQAVLAQEWGQLQVLYEDTEIEAVYFMNPLDAATYLASANVSLQTAFGMSYLSDFLGLGTVIFNSAVEKGKIYATAKENIVLYYVDVNDGDIGRAFQFTKDETGYIGIHEHSDYTNLTSQDTVMSGIVLFPERVDGIVKGEIAGE